MQGDTGKAFEMGIEAMEVVADEIMELGSKFKTRGTPTNNGEI